MGVDVVVDVVEET